MSFEKDHKLVVFAAVPDCDRHIMHVRLLLTRELVGGEYESSQFRVEPIFFEESQAWLGPRSAGRVKSSLKTFYYRLPGFSLYANPNICKLTLALLGL